MGLGVVFNNGTVPPKNRSLEVMLPLLHADVGMKIADAIWAEEAEPARVAAVLVQFLFPLLTVLHGLAPYLVG